MEDGIQIYSNEDEGLQIAYKNPNWMVGIKNYKMASDARYMEQLERHHLTDELFAPLTEGNVLVYLPTDGSGTLRIEPMEIGKVYSVTRGTWHNVVMHEDGKLVLMENTGTCADNSSFYPLNDAERKEIQNLATMNEKASSK